jgi:hypothetical protein
MNGFTGLFVKKSDFRLLAIIALILSGVLTGLGGYMDMTKQKAVFGLSKKHAWNDGLYLAIVAAALTQL